MHTFIIFAAVVISLVNAGPNCNSDRKGTKWCTKRINEMKLMTGYNAASPASPFTGNKCTTYASDNGMFRDVFCCKSCKEFLGGSDQAIKDGSYMYTKVGNTCSDSSAAKVMCEKFTAGSSLCTGYFGKIFCQNTCGWCDATTQQQQHSTKAPCTALEKCNNQTMCGVTGVPSAGQCTTDGLTPGTGAAPYLDGGVCGCEDCESYLGKSCSSDTMCGGFDHHCQAMDGKCACPSCTLHKVCIDDSSCGGVVGTCGYIATGAVTTADMGKLLSCPAAGFGTDGEICRCQWCPDSIPCRNHLGTCTPTTAVADCGHASFCQDSKCVCKAPKTFTGTTEWTPPADATAAAAAEAAPICIQDLVCGKDADAVMCGLGNEGACRALDGASPCTEAKSAYGTAPKCKCSCKAITPMPSPNLCLGSSTGADGTTPLSCALGSTTECGQGTTAGSVKYDICVPNMSTAMCICGLGLYPKYSPYTDKKCSSDTDCQSGTDTAALCSKAGATAAPCDATALADAAGCTCKVATLTDGALIHPTCIKHADCGWGKCVNAAKNGACTDTDPIASTCVCVAAGCVAGESCGLTNSADTCGGTSGCAGKCLCG